MVDFEFTIINNDGSRPGFEYLDYDLTKYFDKPGELRMKLMPDSPVSMDSTITAEYMGICRFRGFIDYPEVNEDSSIDIIASEQQSLLNYRITHFYNYPAGTTISQILSDDVPGDVPGLLFMANCLIPQGAFVVSSGSIYKIRGYDGTGGGTSSVFGTLTRVFQDEFELTNAGAIPSANTQWYQDATDLYVWTSDSKNPNRWNIFAYPEWKDTLLRIGDIDSSVMNETFAVPYRIGKNKISDEIDRLIKAFGFEYRWRHDLDGYTYLDVRETFGRGSSIRGIAKYIEDQTVYDISRQLTGEPKVSCLLGAGSGVGFTLQTAAAMDCNHTGTWKEEIYTDSHLFAEQLDGAVDKELPDRLEATSWRITCKEDPSLDVFDYVDILPAKYSAVTERVKKITYSDSGEMKIECGRRMLDPSDVIRGKFDLLESFSNMANQYLNTWQFNFNEDSITNDIPFEVKFKVNTDEIDTEFEYRFYLSLSLNWYRACNQIDPNMSSPDGPGGGGGGGGNTQAGTPHMHTTIPTIVNTSIATGTLMEVTTTKTFSISWSGDGTHAHSLTTAATSVPSASDYALIGCDFQVTSGSSTHNHNIGGLKANTDPSTPADQTIIGLNDGSYITINLTAAASSDTCACCTTGNYATSNGECVHSLDDAYPAPIGEGGGSGTHTHSTAPPGHTHPIDSSTWTITMDGAHTHTITNTMGRLAFGTATHTHPLLGNTTPETIELTLPTVTLLTDYVPDSNHYHQIGVVISNEGGHTHHYVIDSDQVAAAIVYRAQQMGVGYSIHYLDIAITSNGNAVDGSPFRDYYPGDSISDIDITDLINIAEENTLIFSISDHDDPTAQVRCSINGSVVARYLMTEI